jgi:pimeloyl-ACP methyl ester carboxylesterase
VRRDQVLDRERSLLSINKFDFFVVHFNETLSAFSGDLLWDQTEFVNDCIKFILSIYDKNLQSSPNAVKPSSVILIGHSMGGIIARAVFIKPNYTPKSVKNIISLNSPQLFAIRIAPKAEVVLFSNFLL